MGSRKKRSRYLSVPSKGCPSFGISQFSRAPPSRPPRSAVGSNGSCMPVMGVRASSIWERLSAGESVGVSSTGGDSRCTAVGEGAASGRGSSCAAGGGEGGSKLSSVSSNRGRSGSKPSSSGVSLASPGAAAMPPSVPVRLASPGSGWAGGCVSFSERRASISSRDHKWEGCCAPVPGMDSASLKISSSEKGED